MNTITSSLRKWFVAPTCATLLAGTAWAAGSASLADRTFVGSVSQGGLYEVEAGKVAATRGGTPVVRNLGLMESHDHSGVNAALKRIASMTGVTLEPGLNAEFTERLAKLRATPKAEFDAVYVSDMKRIHDKDAALFVKESTEGSAPYQSFARDTAVLVKAHIGWLGTL